MSKAIKEAGKEKLKHPHRIKSFFPSLHMPSVDKLKKKWEIKFEKFSQLKARLKRKKNNSKKS